MFVIPKPLTIPELEALLMEFGLVGVVTYRASHRTHRGRERMIMVRAIIRPEKTDDVLAALMDAGFPAVTKMDVYGRGKQRGIKIGEVTYDELPKEMIFTVVKESDKDYVVKIIMQAARTGDKGAYGDGKIFVSPVDEVYTVSSGRQEVAEEAVAPGSGLCLGITR